MTTLFRLSLTVLVFFFTTAYQSAEAYFSPYVAKKPICAVVPRSVFQPEKSSHVLLLSSNDEEHLRFSSYGPATTSELALFYYLDKLPVPDSVVRTNPLFIEHSFSIDNLLYANLKLSHLVEEYKNLQYRSKFVLDGLDVPFITQDSGQEAGRIGNDFTSTELAERLQSYSYVIDNRNYFSQYQSQSVGPNDFSLPRRSSNQWRYARQDPVGGSVLPDTVNEEGDTDVDAQQDRQYSPTNTGKLPWVFRISIDVFNYMVRNKLKTAIYFLMLYSIFHILFVARR